MATTPLSSFHANNNSSSNRILATEAPSSQRMDRTGTAYRIPPSVFERTKTNSPVDWSIASNESLFSIQGGNMSFNNDSFLFRSGDLHGASSMNKSDKKQQMTTMFSCSSSAHDQSSLLSGNGSAMETRSREMGIAEATMKEVIKENEAAGGGGGESCNPHHHSRGSNTSIMSYAFSSPMAGDIDKGASSSSTKSRPEQAHEQEQEQSAADEADDESKLVPETATPTATATESAPNGTKWLPCFPCG